MNQNMGLCHSKTKTPLQTQKRKHLCRVQIQWMQSQSVHFVGKNAHHGIYIQHRLDKSIQREAQRTITHHKQVSQNLDRIYWKCKIEFEYIKHWEVSTLSLYRKKQNKQLKNTTHCLVVREQLKWCGHQHTLLPHSNGSNNTNARLWGPEAF